MEAVARRKGSGRRVVTRLLLAAAGLDLGISAQPTILVYQSRGNYSEGIQTQLSTGAAGLDLIGALVDYHEGYASLPPSFRLLFFLPKHEQVHVTVRESDSRYSYWLDKVQPRGGWQPEHFNHFGWPTAVVVRALNWRGALRLDDLAATARLGSSTPGKVEQVLPVALYYSRAPKTADRYAFIFLPNKGLRLAFEIFAERGGAALDRQTFPNVLAKKPHTVRWPSKEWPDGWYRLVIKGWALSDNAPVEQIVRFYHARRLEP